MSTSPAAVAVRALRRWGWFLAAVAGTLFSPQFASCQTISEFPIPSSNSSPNGITLGPDGNLWFAEFNTYKISRVTPDGNVTEFGTFQSSFDPGPPGLTQIAAGPDGNLWFTEANTGKVGMMTPAGLYQYAINPFTATPRPFGIVSGNDGSLWITETGTGYLGRATPGQFSVVDFPIPTVNSDPRGITSGPDGALWFVEFANAANQIGRRTFAGAFTEYPIPTPNSNPLSITTGPDGNLWFTESSDSANQIGRLTLLGVFTEFPIPTSNSGASTITAGPDGNLWFTETKANQIGRITPGGVITEFPIPTAASEPLGITAGPLRTLWFTERAGNKIGRVTLPPTGFFYTLTPCRLIDTRKPDGPSGGPAMFAGTARSFPVTNVCGVPSTAKAVAVNLTITQPDQPGYLILYPGSGSIPLVSNINYSPGQTRANSAVVTLGIGGDLEVRCGQASGSVHVILDISGYFD